MPRDWSSPREAMTFSYRHRPHLNPHHEIQKHVKDIISLHTPTTEVKVESGTRARPHCNSVNSLRVTHHAILQDLVYSSQKKIMAPVRFTCKIKK